MSAPPASLIRPMCHGPEKNIGWVPFTNAGVMSKPSGTDFGRQPLLEERVVEAQRLDGLRGVEGEVRRRRRCRRRSTRGTGSLLPVLGAERDAPLGAALLLHRLGHRLQLVPGRGRLGDAGLLGDVGAVVEEPGLDVPRHAVRGAVDHAGVPGALEERARVDVGGHGSRAPVGANWPIMSVPIWLTSGVCCRRMAVWSLATAWPQSTGVTLTLTSGFLAMKSLARTSAWCPRCPSPTRSARRTRCRWRPRGPGTRGPPTGPVRWTRLRRRSRHRSNRTLRSRSRTRQAARPIAAVSPCRDSSGDLPVPCRSVDDGRSEAVTSARPGGASGLAGRLHATKS